MSGHGLAPDDLKRQYSTEIKNANTFKTHGVSEQAALDYLETPEGEKFLRFLKEANPAAANDTITARALDQLTSGRDLPRIEVINEPLVKIVPAGLQDKSLAYSPFLAKESEFNDELAKGHNLNDRFGLPVKSEAPVYDVYRINPKGPTEVFVSEVAPTSELNGQIKRAGGATQYLVPNRSLFDEAVRTTNIGNNLALHNERVVGKGLGVTIAPLTESAAARGLRPGAGTAAKGLGVVGVAATAYDIADTARDVGRLSAQGNATAAEDRITRFAAQNLGGWAGAAAGFGAGAAAGVESGPGLLVTGAVGGVIGAVAGDEVAGWIRDYKINHQDDRQGNTWTFDPDQPGRGWSRTDGNLFDRALGRSRTLTAEPALANELTCKASSRSIELALEASPQNRDPYRLPVEAADVTRRQPFETSRTWTRNPESGHWRQEITELVGGRIPLTRHEPASADQAVALEQRSKAIIAQNAQQTPAAMAAQFQAAYEHNGWSRYGPMPEAASNALRHPGRIVGSDGDLYERNAQGQWTHDGMLWDSKANGSLRHELETTYQAQQGQRQRVTTLEPVVVRPDPELTQGQSAPASRTASPLRPNAPDQSDRALLEKLSIQVRNLDQQVGKGWDENSERMSASALVMAKRMGFTENDNPQLTFNRPTEKHAAGEILHLSRPHASADPVADRIHMPTAEALSKPVEERFQQVQDIAQQQERDRQQAQARGPDDQSRSGLAR